LVASSELALGDINELLRVGKGRISEDLGGVLTTAGLVRITGAGNFASAGWGATGGWQVAT
jgi:hypothetical protein